MPVPSAVPRMSESWSAEVALPCPDAATPRSTTRVTAEYMKPMPRPGRIQVRIVISGGTPGSTAGSVSADPTAMSTKPSAMNRRGPHASIRRACSHVPTVHAIVVTVNTIPVSMGVVPRHVWSRSGM